MSMDTLKQHGAFSWNELLVKDVDQAKSFYGELFGWILQDINAGGTEYTIAKIGDKEVAGIMKLPVEFNSMPAAWGAYVTVNDVDDSIKRAEKLGGKVVMPPRDIPDLGRFSVISDPQGAYLTLITYDDKK